MSCKSGDKMDAQHREIRALLSGMAPRRATEAVRAAGLPPTCIVEVDVLGRSCLQTAARLNLSVDGLYKLRRRAYAHLADDIRG